jgi:hypothetical protein
MDILTSALIHVLGPKFSRRLCGYRTATNLVLHIGIIVLFIGTSTHGLMQAEAAGILFSLWIEAYRWAFGFETWSFRTGWTRYAGHLTRQAA